MVAGSHGGLAGILDPLNNPAFPKFDFYLFANKTGVCRL
jgi:hypothetical protein